jgi:hypothetical protein
VSSPFRERQVPLREARRALKRAIERDQAGDTPGVVGEHTLVRIAADLGVSESSVHEALRETEPAAAEEPPPGLLGGPRKLSCERVFDGELGPDRHEDIADAIREVMGVLGRTEVVGKSIAWTATPTPTGLPRELSVSVRSRHGKTRLKIEENMTQVLLGTWFGLGFAVGIGGGVGAAAVIGLLMRSSFVGAAVAVAALIAALNAAHWVARLIIRSRARQLRELERRLADALTAGTALRITDDDAGARAEREADDEAAAEAEADDEVGRNVTKEASRGG